jgi:hypothetical protein
MKPVVDFYRETGALREFKGRESNKIWPEVFKSLSTFIEPKLPLPWVWLINVIVVEALDILNVFIDVSSYFKCSASCDDNILYCNYLLCAQFCFRNSKINGFPVFCWGTFHADKIQLKFKIICKLKVLLEQNCVKASYCCLQSILGANEIATVGRLAASILTKYLVGRPKVDNGLFYCTKNVIQYCYANPKRQKIDVCSRIGRLLFVVCLNRASPVSWKLKWEPTNLTLK